MTVAGRDAIAVAATPRRDVLGSGSAKRPYDRIEVAVDAELGILLRRTETSGGEVLTRTELTAVTMNLPEAADAARFAPPPGSQFGEDLKETMRQKFSGPGWDAADVAAGGLGALIKHVPHRRGHGAAEEQPEAMPSPDPPPLGPADGSPPPDEVLDLLYRSGEPRDLGAAARQWHDLAVVAAWVPERARAAGRGGFASLLDAMTSDENVLRMDTRLRVSGPDRYRLDFSPRPQRNASTTIACDGERRWQVYPDLTMVGPAAPLAEHIAFLADACWLLRARLSGGTELTYRGRPARQLRVTRAPGGEARLPGPLMLFPPPPPPTRSWTPRPAACSACSPTTATRSRPGGSWTTSAPSPPTRTSSGCTSRPAPAPWRKPATCSPTPPRSCPGVKGTAARAAAEAVNRTAGAVSAARSFLDDLRGHR